MNIVTPNHIAIIPDGNRRWAREHKLPTLEGHRRGFDVGLKIGRKIRSLGVNTTTFWAFSTENWNRTPEEINYLMKLYELFVDKNLKEALKEKIRIIHIGRKDRIPKSLLKKITNNKFLISNLSEENFNKFLDTKDQPYPNPDLIIRTSGEQRTSGLMIWQAAYAEYVFLNKHFPDLKDIDIDYAVQEYSRRQRRFGK